MQERSMKNYMLYQSIKKKNKIKQRKTMNMKETEKNSLFNLNFLQQMRRQEIKKFINSQLPKISMFKSKWKGFKKREKKKKELRCIQKEELWHHLEKML
jgi:hypothetical protein